jgi:transcriptional regulator with XRE-family HTH domain
MSVAVDVQRDRGERRRRNPVGDRIRRRREELGAKQEAIAHRIGRSRRWYLDLEAGRADPTLSDLLALADVLRTRLDWLLADVMDGQSDTRGADGVGTLDPQGDENTQRRTFLALLAALSAGIDVERMAAMVGLPTAIDAVYVSEMGRVTDALVGSWYTVAPRALLPAVSGHFATLRALLPGPPRFQPALASTAGRAAALLGHVLIKLDRRGEAYAQYASAEALARDARDGTLRALTLALRSGMFSPVSLSPRHGDSARALAELDEAIRCAGAAAPPLLRVVVHARRAEERAAAGDAPGAQRDLERAETALAPAGAETFYGPRDAAEMGAMRGVVQGLLGQHKAALETLDATLAGMTPSVVAWRAAVLADQGAALAQQAEVEEACVRLGRALDLAERSSAGDHVQRVLGIRRMHLAAHGGTPAVRALDDRLAQIA